MKAVAKLLADFFAWRWAPAVGLLATSMLYVIVVVGLVPSEIGVPVANAKFAPRTLGASATNANGELGATAYAAQTADTTPGSAPQNQPARSPVSDFGRRGFSPRLDRPEPPQDAPPPPPPPTAAATPPALPTGAITSIFSRISGALRPGAAAALAAQQAQMQQAQQQAQMQPPGAAPPPPAPPAAEPPPPANAAPAAPAEGPPPVVVEQPPPGLPPPPNAAPPPGAAPDGTPPPAPPQ